MNEKNIDYNEEYFYLIESGTRYPSLDYDDDNDNYDVELYEEAPLDTTETRIVCFGDPVPRKPLLADHHYLIEGAPVISDRLKNVLESLNLKNMQFIPAIIRDDKEDEHEGFFIIHVYNMIRCMDKEQSKWRPSPWNSENAINIDKLVLDNEALDKIPLEDRLVFALDELGTFVLYHQSIIEKILEIEPTGLTIYRLSKYDPSAPFKEEYFSKLSNPNENE